MTIQSIPIINSSDGIEFTQDDNMNVSIAVDDTVTVQGNNFNGVSQLVKLDETGALPAVDGSNLTGIEADTSNLADKDLSNITSNAATNLNTVGARTVVETYQNGTEWYRIWSDGCIEQGGQYTTTGSNQTYNYLRPFSDTNYTLLGNLVTKVVATVYMQGQPHTKTATNFQSIDTAGRTFNWYACGY